MTKINVKINKLTPISNRNDTKNKPTSLHTQSKAWIKYHKQKPYL